MIVVGINGSSGIINYWYQLRLSADPIIGVNVERKSTTSILMLRDNL